MGKILQIRVIAYTYNQDEVEKTWPTLFHLAFNTQRSKTTDKITVANILNPLYNGDHGVLSLAQALQNGFEFDSWSLTLKQTSEQSLKNIGRTVQNLNTALADWQAGEANRLSNILEDQMDSLEEIISSQLKF